jgi:hypothetical protein
VGSKVGISVGDVVGEGDGAKVTQRPWSHS